MSNIWLLCQISSTDLLYLAFWATSGESEVGNIANCKNYYHCHIALAPLLLAQLPHLNGATIATHPVIGCFIPCARAKATAPGQTWRQYCHVPHIGAGASAAADTCPRLEPSCVMVLIHPTKDGGPDTARGTR